MKERDWRSYERAVELAHLLQPDIVLMDLQMPVLDGVAATRRIRAEVPHTQVIVLTTFNDDDYIYAGIAAGARGYLLKDAPPEQLVEAIRVAYRGESLLDPEVAARLLDRFSSMVEKPTSSAAIKPNDKLSPATDKSPKLTPREQEVLILIAQGLRNREIAEQLVIAERTVKIHVGNILGKLNAANRTEAVAIAIKLDLL